MIDFLKRIFCDNNYREPVIALTVAEKKEKLAKELSAKRKIKDDNEEKIKILNNIDEAAKRGKLGFVYFPFSNKDVQIFLEKLGYFVYEINKHSKDCDCDLGSFWRKYNFKPLRFSDGGSICIKDTIIISWNSEFKKDMMEKESHEKTI
jgi:hypothetical protein